MEQTFSLPQIALDPASVILGGVAGFLIAVIILMLWIISLSQKRAALQAHLDAQKNGMDDHFRVMAQNVLNQNSENFLMMAQEKLSSAQKDVRHDLDKRSQSIADMVKPVETVLSQLKGAVDQLQGTGTTIREDLQTLSRETSRLTGALKNPAAQGKWGEFVLERLLDKSNLIKGIHYETQVTMEDDHGRTQRPDVVISLQDGFHIIIDSKAPISDFMLRLDEQITDAERQEICAGLSRAVRAHIKALAARGYNKNQKGPDFVVLFLPSEHVFSSALLADPSLVDYAAEHQVVVASPTLVLSLLRVVALSWRQVELAKNAQDISRLGGELFDRMTNFAGHLAKIGKGIEGAVGAYNKAVGVLESRVMVSARKLKDLQGLPAEDTLETPMMIESSLRPLTSGENEIDEEKPLTPTEKRPENRYA